MTIRPKAVTLPENLPSLEEMMASVYPEPRHEAINTGLGYIRKLLEQDQDGSQQMELQAMVMESLHGQEMALAVVEELKGMGCIIPANREDSVAHLIAERLGLALLGGPIVKKLVNAKQA